MQGLSAWDGFNALTYNLAAIPLLALALFLLFIGSRALLKSQLSGISLLLASLVLSTAMLLSIVWIISEAVPQIDTHASLIRAFAAAVLLAAFLVPREIRR